MKAKETEMGVEKSKNEVLRKIGRNMLLFQQVEQMPKFLITNGTLSGYASESQGKREQQAKLVHKQTMGQLVGQFLENTHSAQEETSEQFNQLGEP